MQADKPDTAAWRKTDGVWRIYSELFVGLFCNGADG